MAKAMYNTNTVLPPPDTDITITLAYIALITPLVFILVSDK